MKKLLKTGKDLGIIFWQNETKKRIFVATIAADVSEGPEGSPPSLPPLEMAKSIIQKL